jgi:hypothetical protein
MTSLHIQSVVGFLLLAALAGCGVNRSRLATEQLVITDAVDQAVANVDFSALSGKKVFFDTKYLTGLKFPQGANIEYVISSLRQQMLAYDCRLQDKAEDADCIVEARVGALGNDGIEQTYGVPGTAAVMTASTLLMGTPIGGAVPELSIGRRNHHMGAAKIGIFAYDRETREPVWQAGVAKGSSQAQDIWLFGFGPFERGRIYERNTPPSMLSRIFARHKEPPEPSHLDAYRSPLVFERPQEPQPLSPIQPAAHATPLPPPGP